MLLCRIAAENAGILLMANRLYSSTAHLSAEGGQESVARRGELE